MIRYISGTIKYIMGDEVVVLSGDIGYGIQIGPKSLGMEVGQRVSFYTYTYIRETDLRLFGFEELSDLELFEMLLDVNGVGPKASLSLVSALGAGNIIKSIMKKDPVGLKVPGIGAKTTNKIILELHDTLKKKGYSDKPLSKQQEMKLGGHKKVVEDLRQALMSLGYGSKDIERVVDEVEKDEGFMGLKSEELLKKVLTKI